MEQLCLAFAWIIKKCYLLLNNYGGAIILFTVISKIILMPLTVWTHINSIAMIKIQPAINHLHATYYGQKDLIAEEESKLYKENHYHPLLSVIPLVFQILLLMGVIEAIKLGMQDLSINMIFCGIDMGIVPSKEGLQYIFSPIMAASSSWIMSWSQNKSNVLQSEQSKWNQYSMLLLSVALSLYLGWYVPIGVALYWICSNILSIVTMYLLNWVISPRKYVDYKKLEESRKELAVLKDVGKSKKYGFFSEAKKKERTDYKRFFSVANKHLVFYSEGKGFYKYYKGIIEYLLRNTNLTIHYISSDYNDDIYDIAKKFDKFRTYYIGENRLITLMMKMDADIVVMTTPDLENYHLKKSLVSKSTEYVYIDHAIGSMNMTYHTHALDHYDTIFVANSLGKEEMRAHERLYGLTSRNIIEYGYCLIDEMTHEYNAKERNINERPTILIAPSWSNDNIADSCFEELVDNLLGRGYHVIFRPHPQYVKHKKTRLDYYDKKYAEYEDFEIQMDFSANDTVMNADVLITDWSGIAYEYSFVTLKPTLFIDTPMKVMNPDYELLGIKPFDIVIRNSIGMSLKPTELNRISETVEILLHSHQYSKETLENVKRQYLYNVDNSAKVAAEYLVSSLQNKISKKQ